jgi:predicted glycosyltransferase
MSDRRTLSPLLHVVPSPAAAGEPTAPTRRLRIALYSHDALGLGHLRRNLALATAFTAGFDSSERCPDVLLFAGALESTDFTRPEGCDLVTLPSLRKYDDGRYGARQLSFELDEVVARRTT